MSQISLFQRGTSESAVDIIFEVPLEPESKGAPRANFHGKGVRKSSKTAKYEERFDAAAAKRMPAEPIQGPLIVDFIFALKRPDYMRFRYAKTGLYKYPVGLIPCAKKPDLDNLRKAAQDALKRWWGDDAQIVGGTTLKFIAELDKLPRVLVRIRTLDDVASVLKWAQELQQLQGGKEE